MQIIVKQFIDNDIMSWTLWG